MKKKILQTTLVSAFLIVGGFLGAQQTFASGWENVGGAGFSESDINYLSIAFSPSTNEPYVVYSDGSKWSRVTVMKFNGSSWQTVGTTGFSTSTADSPSIAFNPSTNEPYVAFSDKYSDETNSYKATVMKFNGSSWQTVGNACFSAGRASNPSIVFNPSTNEPYVVYSDETNSYKATVMKFNGSSWQTVGTAGFSVGTAGGNPSMAFNPSTNEPYVTYTDGAYSSKTTVMKFNGSSWQTVGTAGFSVGGVSYTSIAFNPSTNEPYVSYRDDANLYKATTMKFSGGTWQTVGNVGFSTGAASSISLAFNSSTGEPYVAYKDYSKSDKAVVMKFSGGSWQSVGNAGFSANGVNYISLAFNPSTNEPYVAFRDKSSDRPTVLKYSESNIQITTDTPTLAYNVSKKAKKRISYTFTNLSLINKKYVIMRIGGRKVEVVGLRRSGTSSIVTVELKYAKWGRGSYNLAMSYKNKTKVAYKTKKGKTKYKKGWERGSVAQDSVLQIL